MSLKIDKINFSNRKFTHQLILISFKKNNSNYHQSDHGKNNRIKKSSFKARTSIEDELKDSNVSKQNAKINVKVFCKLNQILIHSHMIYRLTKFKLCKCVKVYT